MLAGASVLAGNNFRVSDTYVTVFEEPERINALGRMNQGEEFEAIGRDGSLLIFMYKGKKRCFKRQLLAGHCRMAEKPFGYSGDVRPCGGGLVLVRDEIVQQPL